MGGGGLVGGAVASWLVRSSRDRAVRVRALARDIVLCSWASHFTLTVPLSTQEYKWVPAICWEKPNKLLGSDLLCDELSKRIFLNCKEDSCRPTSASSQEYLTPQE